MISKELLGEVLGIKVAESDKSSTADNILYYLVEADDWWYSINIYELAHKCKEWALINGWYLNAWFTLNEGAFCDGMKPPTDSEIHIEAETEPEAIFKACEWIRKQNATNN